jgi:hypothetical protein
MDVKIAVATAKKYLGDLLSDEKVVGLTLEEVWFDENLHQWNVTLGVHRGLNPLLAGMKVAPDYKVLKVRDADGQVLSVMNRNHEAA